MSPKRRVTKRSMREDQFVTAVFRAREWAENNLYTVLIAIGAVVVIIAAIWFFTAQAKGKQQEAYDLLARAEMAVRSNQPQAAIVDLEQLLEDYGGSNAARLGALTLANVYFSQNQFDKAEEMFATYIDDYLIDEMSRYSAMEGIAAAQSAQGKFQEAGEKYLEVARLTPSAVTYEDNLFYAVENFIKAGDEERAREAFALLAEEGLTSAKYRTAKILMIENGFLTYDEGEFE